jgi:CBS domain containing-hemolysin-like protein
MTSPWYFASIIAFLILAAFFSAAEMAYASVNRIRLENAREAGSRRAAAALKVCDRYDDALSPS